MARMLALRLALLLVLAASLAQSTASVQFPFQDYTLPNAERIEDLISRLTLQEKAEQLVSMSPGIPRLNWNAFNWRSECCHGWGFTGKDYEGSGWNGTATVYPHVIGLAATMDEELVQAIGHAAGTEGRATYNSAKKQGIHGHMMTGLHCFGPTTNVNHDPRWGRIKRTWGEDPFLTGTLNSAHIKGLQGGDKKYMKIAADVNMFAIHSGPDSIRTHFDIDVSDRDLYDFYLPAFEQTVKEGGVSSVMIAYSAFQGIPDNCNARLLTEVLLKEWNFSMISFSDNGGVRGITATQKYTSSYTNASALSINAGLHQDMASGGPSGSSWSYGGCIWNQYLPEAVNASLVKEELLDNALRRVLGVRFALGAEDPDWLVPFSDIGMDVIGCSAHTELALEAARKSIVLLQNNGTLPLPRASSPKLLLVGPHANSTSVYFGGSYSAFPTVPTSSILELLTDSSKWSKTHPLHETIKNMDVIFSPGCSDVLCKDTSLFAAALQVAQNADIIVYVGGIDGDHVEHEGGDRGTESSNWKMSAYPCEQSSTDALVMPGCQEQLITQLAAVKPVVVVHMNGGPLSCINCTYLVSAVLETFYGGQAGSQAIVETLFGVNNPAGRLPYTVHDLAEELYNFTDYGIPKGNDDGRTYRYISPSNIVQRHFGDGLSYTTFNYTMLEYNKTVGPCEDFHFNVTVTNAGQYQGDEVTQVYFYIAPERAPVRVPRRALKAFKRINLDVGQATKLSFCISPYARSIVDSTGTRQLYSGEYNFSVGGHQIQGMLSFSDVIEGDLTVPATAGHPTSVVPLSQCKDARLRC